MSELKLTIELVPNPLWGRDLAKIMPRKEWDKLRKQVYAQYYHHCGICGADGRMICHEIWHYDDVNHIQRLTGFIALCDMCNNCKHIGRSGVLARQGKLEMKAVVDHFCNINGISWEEYKVANTAAFNQWRERNKHEWTQDFGEYSSLVHQ
jgi:hypothetical protein